MAAAPWACENCGAVNAPAARLCGICAVAAPQPSRGRSRALWVLATLMLVAVAAVGTTLILAARHTPTTASPAGSFPSYTTPVIPPSTTATQPPAAVAPTTSTSPTGKPCPADALPGGSGTVLLAAQTRKFLVTVCQTAGGEIFYHGQALQDASSSITLPAQRQDDGFVAINGTYRYTIGGGRLVVTNGAEALSDDELTPAG